MVLASRLTFDSSQILGGSGFSQKLFWDGCGVLEMILEFNIILFRCSPDSDL
jgi:hypothetical protein